MGIKHMNSRLLDVVTIPMVSVSEGVRENETPTFIHVRRASLNPFNGF